MLNLMIYADDCAPGGGGFTLWPGSHRQCYYHMETEVNMEPLSGPARGGHAFRSGFHTFRSESVLYVAFVWARREGA
jgi:hypothetical protein